MPSGAGRESPEPPVRSRGCSPEALNRGPSCERLEPCLPMTGCLITHRPSLLAIIGVVAVASAAETDLGGTLEFFCDRRVWTRGPSLRSRHLLLHHDRSRYFFDLWLPLRLRISWHGNRPHPSFRSEWLLAGLLCLDQARSFLVLFPLAIVLSAVYLRRFAFPKRPGGIYACTGVWCRLPVHRRRMDDA